MSVDLALAKQELRVDHDEEDALIARYLAAAVAWVENYTGKLLTRREVTQEADGFGAYFRLFYGPSPASLTIDYTQPDNMAGSITDAKIVRNRAYPSSAWPNTPIGDVITLTYTAGFAQAPAELESAVLLHLRARYEEERSGEDASAAMMAIEAVCRPYRSLRV